MKYAMTLNNRVIDIVNSDITPDYPPSNDGEPIVPIEISEDLDIKLGMYYDNETHTFAEYIKPAPEPTQLDRIEANMDYLVLLNS